MRYTIEKENEVKRLAAEGKSSSYICSLTNIPERVIWGWCPETRPHDDKIKWSVKQRFHSVFPEFEAKISGFISPLMRDNISEKEWDSVGNVIYNTLFDEAILVFKNLLEEPPEFGSKCMLSKEPFLDYLKRFWTEDSDYAIRKQLSSSYIKQNHDSIHFWSLLKKRLVCEINSGDVERVFESVSSKGLSQSRINAIMKVGLIPLKQAYKEGLIFNRCHEFVLPSVERKETNLSPIVVAKIFNSKWNDEEAFVANLTAYYAHLQLQETRALRLADIYNGIINVRYSYSDKEGLIKNKTPRSVCVPSFITDVILKYAATSPWDFNKTGYVFYSESENKPARGTNWSKELTSICKQNKLQKISFTFWKNS